MAFLQLTNAETGIYSAEGWDRVLAGWEVLRDNTVAHSGSWSWLVNGDGQFRAGGWLLPSYTPGRWYLVRFWLRIAAVGSSHSLGLAPGSGNNPMAQLQLNTDGTLQADASGTWGFPTTKSAPLIAGNWHKLEFAGRADASPNYNWLNGIWRLDGVEFQRHCGRPAKGAFNKMYASAGDSAPRTNVDDMVLNDDTGTSFNWWNDGAKPLSTGKTKPSARSVGTTVTNTVAGNSIVVNAPPSIASGDTLTMVVEFAGGGPGTLTLPSGWTQRMINIPPTGGGGILVATKVATGSEPSTYTVSWTISALRGHSVCYAIAGVNANPVIDVQSLGVGTASADINFIFPALDLSEGDALILQAASITEATPTKTLISPAWWTNAVNVADTTNGHALACGVFGQDDGGLTATGLMGATGSSNLANVTVAAIAFRAGAPPQSITPTGIASAQAFGTPVVGRGAVLVAPSGIASAQALGTPRVGAGISPSGIASAQAFGRPTVTGSAVSIAPGGISTAQAFGTARVTLLLIPTGIASAQVFGTPAVGIIRAFHPLGIPSAEAFGRPGVTRTRSTTVVLLPAGVAPAQAFGVPTVSRGAVTIVPVGIASAEAVGLGGIGRPVIVPRHTGTGALSLMLIRRSGLRH